MRSKHNNINSKYQILKIISHLKKTAITDSNTITWTYANKHKYNISLSHGMPSTLLFLAETLSLNFITSDKDVRRDIENMISSGINYILKQQININLYKSHFPMFPKEAGIGISRSRLAWCYGDLGIAIALLRIGIMIKDKNLKCFAIKILEYNAIYRRSLFPENVMDAEICHGACGIAIIFQRTYELCKNSIFLESFNYWKENVKNMVVKDSNGIYKYPTFNPSNNSWIYESSLLDGNAGIGLFLLSTLSQDWSWNKILLMQ